MPAVRVAAYGLARKPRPEELNPTQMNSRILLWMAAVLASGPCASAFEASDLYGTWQLVSATRVIVATGVRTNAYGPAPKGYLTYGNDGRMSAIIVDTTRSKPADRAIITDGERAALHKTMLAYAGTFSVEGSTVHHCVDISWNESYTGTNQVRHARLDGDTLYLTTNPRPITADGKVSVGELKWVRLKSPPGPPGK